MQTLPQAPALPVTWTVSADPRVKIAVSPAELRSLRHRLYLTQKRVGRIVGCSQPVVSHAETGARPVSAQVLMRLAGLYILATKA
jgi:hypothetical protein